MGAGLFVLANTDYGSRFETVSVGQVVAKTKKKKAWLTTA